ncbi:MAG: tetratricopeptide repeat protein [Spirochaetes bacterium]|nr:tetratricopeptide repeat protein [Spirochaetota bacterium]
MSAPTQPEPVLGPALGAMRRRRGYRRARALLLAAVLSLGVLSPMAAQESPVALYQQAQQALAQGEPFRAVELFTAALERNPSYADALRGIAEAYYELGEYDQSFDYAERYLQTASDIARARNLLARVHIGLGNLDRAEELYTSVLTRSPNNLEATIGTAELAVARDATETALARFEEARRLAPTNRRVLLSLALVHRYAGRAEAAERYTMLALQHHPEHPLVHLLAAEYFLEQGRLDRAATQAELTLSLRPQNEDALMLMARIAHLRSDYESAASRAGEVIGLNRSNEVAWYIRAASLEQLDRIDETTETLELGIRAVDDSEFLRLFAEQVLREHRNPDDELRSSFASYHFDRAARFEDQNLLSRALVAYRRGLRLDPYDRRGRVGFAEIFRTRGAPSKYLRELEVLAAVEEEDRFLSDRIESFQSALSETPAREWGVDQFSLERLPFSIDLFVSPEQSNFDHPDGAVVYGEYLRDRLISQEMLTVPRPAAIADGFAQAYGAARTSGSDYFLIVGVQELGRSIRLEGELFLSRTGEPLTGLRAYRTGNDRIERALGGVVDAVAASLPLRGRLLERRGDRGLVSLGELDGLEVDDELVIVRRGGVMLSTEEPGYRFSESEAVGTLVVSRTDALVSEGTVSRRGFFDLISVGDVVVRAPNEDAPAVTEQTPVFPALYRELRRIR